MSFINVRSFGTNFSRSFYNHISNSFKLLNISILALLITACSAGGTDPETQTNTIDQLTSSVAVTLEGSVGDGPITDAQITIKDSLGAVVGTTVSDSTASYTITIPVGVAYPVVIEATGGTDVVTGTAPDFIMLSVASNPSARTVNINPFSTMIVKTAQSMSGGLTAQNIFVATQSVTEQLNFGLNSALISNPVTTPITSANVAAIIKSSEAFGETIRRTRSTLQVSGANFTGDEIVDILARDMTDGIIDGRGQGANVQIAAVSTIISGQVLIEALVNQLNVNGSDSTSLMDLAINISVPNATMTTSDVVITEAMLTQTRTAVAAASTHTPSSSLTAIAVILTGLSGNSMAVDLATALPVDPASTFNEVITQLPLSTNTQLESVNSMLISGAFQFAATDYTVGENDGSVNVTINRVGGSAGTVNVEWRTATFNGDGTADWANDFGTFLWTERVLAFADGETSKVEQISIAQDVLVEGDEHFSVFIRTPAGEVVSTAVVTILDDNTSVPAPEPVPVPVPVPVPSDRPYEDLVNNVVGFAQGVTGGKGGDLCTVSNLNNSGAGSLRVCAESSSPKWIRFSVSGVINLSSKIFIKSNKTIDGRGADITIRNYGLRTAGNSTDGWLENVIIHNIKMADTPSTEQMLSINKYSRKIWVDHVSLTGAGDESIFIGNTGTSSPSATAVTISWCKFTDASKSLLIGASPLHVRDVETTVTVHHNFYNQTGERHPLIRHAKVHTFNNYMHNWTWQASSSSQFAQLASESNIFETGASTRNNLAVSATVANVGDTDKGYARSTNDLFLGNSTTLLNAPDTVFDPASFYSFSPEVADSTLKAKVMSNAGWNNVAFPE